MNKLTIENWKSTIFNAIPISLVALGTLFLYFWLSADTVIGLKERVPIPENAPRAALEPEPTVKIEGKLIQFDGVPADLPGAWPRFRGANFDAISSEDVRLARTWPGQGPKVLWYIELGEGYAGAAVLAGRVYVLDYDQKNEADIVRCLSLADGKDIWRYSYPVKIKRQHGMSRTVPAVTDKYVVTLGPKCHVTCLDSVTGEFRWMLNLVKEFDATVPDWYAGQCPLIDDGKAIIAPGGGALMIAVDCQTGEILWQTPNPNGWLMTHSSIMPTEFMGARMYVYCASGGVVGVSAKDGSILWEHANWQVRTANVPSPVIVGQGLIFLSGGYNAGSMMLRLAQERTDDTEQTTESGAPATGKIVPHEVFRLKPEIFGSGQQTPIFWAGYIYGTRPDKQLVCLDLNGQVVWTSTSANRFGNLGLGPYTIADGLIYIMDDSGVLTLAEAKPSGYIQLAQAKVLQGPEAWGPMAVASGRLIARDLNRMICLDITGQ